MVSGGCSILTQYFLRFFHISLHISIPTQFHRAANIKEGFSCGALHGNLTQPERQEVMERFRQEEVHPGWTCWDLGFLQEYDHDLSCEL